MKCTRSFLANSEIGELADKTAGFLSDREIEALGRGDRYYDRQRSFS